ncbi:cyclic nucleotide-gated ion channel 20 [Populus alba x Populus x berolinensis]|uniref:Cyclic nucleotide-gated ion channel 20 n=1 Tax=Populus alba x Populus x berolinensis TaxID=444605 RepID=A0AAD6LQI6_9ROSI|nr:cyclic nucleotide-gated ion channel 20 [Populus alba x Populus x berolinensis]
MANHDKDNIPTLSDTHPESVDENVDSQFRPFLYRTQSASTFIPLDSMESYGSETNIVGFTGPLRSARKAPLVQMSGPLYINRNTENLFLARHGVTTRKKVDSKPEKYPSLNGRDKNDWDDNYTATNAHLMRSGQLGMCNDPYCTTCPLYYHSTASQQRDAKTSSIFDSKFHSVLYGDAKGWARRFNNAINSYIPGVMNPHTKVVQEWNKFFVLSCLGAIFVDPLFFILLSVKQEEKCIVINWEMIKAVVFLRCLTDAIFLLNILLQFRLAYVAPESRVVGAGELVDHPKKIAKHYLRGFFFIDLFMVLPLPQITLFLLLLPKGLDSFGANFAKNILQAVILVQYIPRLFRFIPLLIGPNGFIFETALANFFINLFTFVLSGHIIGLCWYLFGLQRLIQCLHLACRNSGHKNDCMKFIDSGGHEKHWSDTSWHSWKENANASACFTLDGFSYGIYAHAVNLTGENTIIRYTYSLVWGIQQISTLAGNQTPSYDFEEILFTMAIIGIGLLLFAFLIGNMQNFLQALGRRRAEMSLRQRDVDKWMRHRRLPVELRRRVVEAGRYHWAATRGVNEEMLLENLPEDLQRDIRRHLFKFVKKVWIFRPMDEHVLDAVCEKLKQKIYIKGSEVFCVGGLVEKMVFIVRGKLESIGHDGTVVALSEGNVCGEELLTWFLEHSSVSKDGRKIKISGQRLISSRTVRCLTNVEAFSLSAADLEQVTSLFARNLRNPLVQGAIRYQSPYWRALAATHIQVAWRYRQKCLKHSKTSQLNHIASLSNHSSFSRV